MRRARRVPERGEGREAPKKGVHRRHARGWLSCHVPWGMVGLGLPVLRRACAAAGLRHAYLAEALRFHTSGRFVRYAGMCGDGKNDGGVTPPTPGHSGMKTPEPERPFRARRIPTPPSEASPPHPGLQKRRPLAGACALPKVHSQRDGIPKPEDPAQAGWWNSVSHRRNWTGGPGCGRTTPLPRPARRQLTWQCACRDSLAAPQGISRHCLRGE